MTNLEHLFDAPESLALFRVRRERDELRAELDGSISREAAIDALAYVSLYFKGAHLNADEVLGKVVRWGHIRPGDLSRRAVEKGGWLEGLPSRDPGADPPMGHSEAFDSRDYGASRYGVLAGSADRDGTGTER